MKPSRSTGQLAIVLLSLSSIVSAWPTFLPEIDSLVVRQDNTQSSTGTQPTPTPQPAKPSQVDLNTGVERTTDSASDTATGTGGSKTTGPRVSSTSGFARGNGTRPTFAPEDGAGGVTMVTPAVTAGTQLYKVGDMVTWGWNYTSLQGTPTAIDVLVKCSTATRTWTLTQNMTFATSAAYFWDTGKTHKETPLVVQEYTLMVYDSETGPTAVPEPGYLAPFAGFIFGVYTPSPYTPNASGWKCVSCSGAVSDMIDGRALRFALTMCAVTVATFTWFVTGLGVL